MGRYSTGRKYMGYNEETFEDNNLQELRYFQPEENDAGAFEGHNLTRLSDWVEILQGVASQRVHYRFNLNL